MKISNFNISQCQRRRHNFPSFHYRKPYRSSSIRKLSASVPLFQCLHCNKGPFFSWPSALLSNCQLKLRLATTPTHSYSWNQQVTHGFWLIINQHMDRLLDQSQKWFGQEVKIKWSKKWSKQASLWQRHHTLVILRFRVYRNTGPQHRHQDRHEVSLAIIYANVLNILRCVQLKQISQVNASWCCQHRQQVEVS